MLVRLPVLNVLMAMEGGSRNRYFLIALKPTLSARLYMSSFDEDKSDKVAAGYLHQEDGRTISVAYWGIRGLAAPLRMMVLYSGMKLRNVAYPLYPDKVRCARAYILCRRIYMRIRAHTCTYMHTRCRN